MKRITEFPLEGGGVLHVETDDPSSGPVTRGLPTETMERASETFESALGSVKNAAAAVLTHMQQLPHRPDALEVQFGVKLSGKIGAVLSAVSGEAHFVVRVSWESPPRGPSDG
jgi:hypothetical protein